MPLATNNAQSLILGAPRVTREAGRVTLRQSRLIGWALIAMGGVLPGAVAYAHYGDRPGELLRDLTALSGIAFVMALVMISLAALLATYGVFWMLWRRVFDIDPVRRRWTFVSGIGPWATRLAGGTDAAFTLHLRRKRIAASRVDGTGGLYPFGGGPLHSWEVRLAVPEGGEPLFLGEWGEERDARAEVAAWRALLPAAALVEEGQSP